MNLIKKIVPLLFFGSIFFLVVYFIEPTKDITQLSIIKDLAFFLPLLIFLTYLLKLFIKSSLCCLVISLSLVLLLTLKALNNLNLVSAALTTLGTFLILKSIKKNHAPSYSTKLPKLSKLKKQ